MAEKNFTIEYSPDGSTFDILYPKTKIEQVIDLQDELDSKQDNLTTQTAYTAKGSGTKVAQITTNTLGQVTNITEVDITKTTLSDLGITATATELNYVDGVTSNVQTQLNSKEPADATILKKAQVIDNVSSTTTNQPLSANQGKLLNDRITNLETLGRFLSLWNCTTGKPLTDPTTLPYDYKSGDYYRISVVDTTTNYTPNGTQYTGAASTTVYEGTSTLQVGDLWFYDGTTWSLMQEKVGGFVEDVHVNGTSVVSNAVADIDLSKFSITATASEINVLDGITATTTELNYTDGVTSNIQTQLNNKQAKLPDIINNKYLHTNSSTGSLEWVDADALPTQTGHSGEYLTTNGSTASWATVTLPSDMTGATSTTAGTHGLVPAPAAGDQNKFLKGDATWGEMVASNTARVALTIVSGTLSYTVTHGLGTRDVTVQIYDGTTYETIMADVTRTTINAVTVEFSALPAHNCVVLFTAMSATSVPSGEEVSY